VTAASGYVIRHYALNDRPLTNSRTSVESKSNRSLTMHRLTCSPPTALDGRLVWSTKNLSFNTGGGQWYFTSEKITI